MSYGWCLDLSQINERKAALVANRKKTMMGNVGLCYMIERWEWEKIYEDRGGIFHPYN
jgi:hypothetical protein